VGCGTYLGRCEPQKLAEGITIGVINQLEKCRNLKRISLIDWGGDSNDYLLKAFESEFQGRDELFGGAVSLDNKGDIRDKNIHGAGVVVSAANTYVGFGSWVSGAIAEQVGDKTEIEAKARELIKQFNSHK
jgi:hypothetical protein